MNQTILYIILSVGSLLTIYGIYFFLYRKLRGQGIHFSAERIKPTVSVVLIVRNNEALIKPVLKRSLELNAETEIIVFDLGSIDKTVKLAKEALSTCANATIVTLGKRSAWENVRTLFPRYVSGDCIFLIDLNRIGMENPNVYVPDLFKQPLNVNSKGLPKPDARIDGVNLLTFDHDEREKNGYVLTEHIVEALSNVSMRLETLESKTSKSIKEELNLLNHYIDQKTRDVTLLTRLVGPVQIDKGNFNDQVISVLKNYGLSTGISIDYKVMGMVQELKIPVNLLIISFMQDLLYVMVQVNLATKVSVNCRYSNRKLSYIFRYEFSGSESLRQENTLSAYVLRSMQNRMNIIGGNLRIKEHAKGGTVILVQLPLDSTTCL